MVSGGNKFFLYQCFVVFLLYNNFFMQILKKADAHNHLADTRPGIKTYDLDKMVRERKAISKIGNTGFTYPCFYCNVEYNDINDCYVCDTKHFIEKYPPNFIREIYPELTIVKDGLISWHYETLLLFHKSDVMKFNNMLRKLECEIIAYGYGDAKVLELRTNKDNKTWDELVNNTLEKINLETS